MDRRRCGLPPNPTVPVTSPEVLASHCPLPSPLLTLCKPEASTLQLVCTVLFFPSRVSLRSILKASSALFAELGSPRPLQTHWSRRPLGGWYKQAGLRPMTQTKSLLTWGARPAFTSSQAQPRGLQIDPGVVHLKFRLESLSDGLAVPPPLGSCAGSSRGPSWADHRRVPCLQL